MRLIATQRSPLGWGSVAEATPSQTLFTNVHVFDGVNAARIANANVLVGGNLIKEASPPRPSTRLTPP